MQQQSFTQNLRKNEGRRDFLKKSLQLTGALAMSGIPLFANNTKGTNMQYLTLNNGIKMPILGFGTYGIHSTKTFLEALEVGYRLFDTAQMYGNEKEVGEACKEAMRNGLSREELFITTKLSSNMSKAQAKQGIDSSLKALDLDYIDLFLIHEPYSQSKAMYEALEEAYKEGKIKSIGISNFTAKTYLDFIKTCNIAPAVNQCETHIFYQQKSLQEAMKPYGTILESWSPFISGKGGFFDHPTLQKLARAHNKSVAQVVLRYLIERNIIVIPKTSNRKHMEDNFNVFDFTLNATEMNEIALLDKNKTQFSWGY